MKQPNLPSLSDSLRTWVQDERSRLSSQSPTDRELHDYLDGALEGPRRLEIEELAALDPSTSARILDLQSGRPRSERRVSPPTEEEKAAHWRSIQMALGEEPVLSMTDPRVSTPTEDMVGGGEPLEGLGSSAGSRFAPVKWLVAGWAATALVLGFWILRLETRPEEGTLTQASHGAEQRVLTEAPRQLELRSRAALTRSQANDPAPRLDQSDGIALLALVPDEFEILGAYRASLREEQGKSFEPEPVSRRPGGGYFLRLELSELTTGSYEIVLEGLRGDGWEVLGIYPLELTGS